MRDHIESFFGRWWRVLVSFASLAVIATMAYVTLSVADDRAEQERDRELAERTNEQLAAIIENERRAQDTRDERLADAVSQVRQVLAEEIAKHDAQMNRLMARQLEQIDRLLRRPEGTPPDPVTARSDPPAPAPSPPSSSSPPVTSTPTTAAPAPTTPRQRSCDRHPGGTHC